VNKILLPALILAGTFGAAFAGLGDVAASFPAPYRGPIALAHANNATQMWLFCNQNTSGWRIFLVHHASGSVYSSFVSACREYTRGLTYEDPGYLWVGNYNDRRVYRCRSVNGSVLYSWAANHGVAGMALKARGDGGVNQDGLFVNAVATTTWRHRTSDGSIISSFTYTPALYGDLAWDWRNKLVWGGDANTNCVYGCTTGGTVLASFRSPAVNPQGLCYYGQYLWVGTNSSPYYVYRVHCPNTVGVAPASLGRVKALFK
jgi:hypothetical protein